MLATRSINCDRTQRSGGVDATTAVDAPDIDALVAIHERWKSNFTLAINTGDDLTTDTICGGKLDAFGRRLQQQLFEMARTHPAAQESLDALTAFHLAAADAADQINRDRIDDTTSLTGDGSRFSKTSTAFLHSLTILRASS